MHWIFKKQNQGVASGHWPPLCFDNWSGSFFNISSSIQKVIFSNNYVIEWIIWLKKGESDIFFVLYMYILAGKTNQPPNITVKKEINDGLIFLSYISAFFGGKLEKENYFLVSQSWVVTLEFNKKLQLCEKNYNLKIIFCSKVIIENK